MNIKPYEEKKDTDPKDTVYLRLITEDSDDTVDLCIVSKDGLVVTNPVIINILKDLSIYRYYTPNKLVFVDENDKIRVRN